MAAPAVGTAASAPAAPAAALSGPSALSALSALSDLSALSTTPPAPQAARAGAAAPWARTPCGWPGLQARALAPGLWWLPAPGPVGAAADAANRGQVAAVLLARHQGRLWALGSGPSPAFGRALDCVARRDAGQPVDAVISPWTRPESVLGVAGLGAAAQRAHWGHAEVRQGMATYCPTCVAQLQQRLAEVPASLRPQLQAVQLPARRLQGEQGELGPWRWWRLHRSPLRAVTVWRWQQGDAPAVWAAPGLLDGPGLPDGRDAELAALIDAAERLVALSAADGPSARWLGDTAPALPADAPRRLLAYWQGLRDDLRAALADGRAETDAPPAPRGLGPAGETAPRHALNWQRAWRQLEGEWLPQAPAEAARR